MKKFDKRFLIGIGLIIITLVVVIICICLTKSQSRQSNPTIETTSLESTTKEVTIEEIIDQYAANLTPIDNEIDTTPPLMLCGSSSTVTKGATDIPAPTLCLDNQTKNVKITYEGSYDLNTIGSYNIVRVATDDAGNQTKKDITLNVVESISETTYTKAPDFQIEDAITKYKNENTEIGIDVSRWQGDIDWAKVKEAGVSFVYIRLGVKDGFDGERYIDRNFVNNYKGAKDAGLKIGVYFYSCATNREDAIKDVKFIANILKENNIDSFDLPIAFDWESFQGLSSISISLDSLNDAYSTFKTIFKELGFDVCLYNSTYYLSNGIWYDNESLWLAQYADAPTYEGGFFMWQCSCTGKVPGINGDVDIDILYKDKLN